MSLDPNPSPSPPKADPGDNRRHIWIGGLALIIVGVVFLVRNLTGFELTNWWALFILIPALVSLGRAWSLYRQDGAMTAPARGALITGLSIAALALVFLLALDWASVWPVFLIITGLGALLNGVTG